VADNQGAPAESAADTPARVPDPSPIFPGIPSPDLLGIEVRVRSLRFITRPKSRIMRAKRKQTFESQQNEGAQ
jgi:hypothetical protein